MLVRTKAVVGPALFVLLLAAHSGAATFLVDASGGADAETIAGGISLAAGGDTVLVAPGTYSGPGNRDLDFTGRDIVLRSVAGAAATTIDCGALGRAFSFTSGETNAAVVSGFRILDGHDDVYGGGVFCEYASPTIEDCVFESCSATDGATQGRGGAIYSYGSTAVIRDCTFRENTAKDGAGVFCYHCSALIADCLFVNNTALSGGGGVRILHQASTVDGCTFIGNSAPTYGGGVFFCYSTPTITDCTFAWNAASQGGAVYGYDASPTITDCILAFSTVGSAVYCPGESSFVISNCCSYGNAGGDDLCGDAFDNIFVDPAFCDTTGGLYALQDCSPCLGTGSGGSDIGAWDAGCACVDTTGVPEWPDASGDPGTQEVGAYVSVIPTPTRLGATIEYSTGTETSRSGAGREAALAIYTADGRLVREFHVAAPSGRLVWDGRDTGGRRVAAGVYFIRMRAEAVERAAKLVVIR